VLLFFIFRCFHFVIAKAILGYLGDTMEGGVHKAPVRVVVLGNRGAGKTSLIQALSGNRYYYFQFSM
jgi:ABC-type molybdenum transport system ATPase subunit/photorepair protein PhrA